MSVTVQHLPGGQIEDVPHAVAVALLAGGHVRLLSELRPDVETAMIAPAETAMLPAAKPRKRGRKAHRERLTDA